MQKCQTQNFQIQSIDDLTTSLLVLFQVSETHKHNIMEGNREIILHVGHPRIIFSVSSLQMQFYRRVATMAIR